MDLDFYNRKPALGNTVGACLVQAHGQRNDQNHGDGHTMRTTSSLSALTSPDKPTMTGTVNTCNKWYDVVKGASRNCDSHHDDHQRDCERD